MLYIIYGNNRDKTRDKTRHLLDTLRKKKPDASFFAMNDETWSSEKVREYALSQGLFENKYIVHFDSVTAKKEIKEELVDLLEDIQQSSNVFVMREGELDKVTLKKLEKHSEKIEEHSKEELKKKPEFNIFALGDALGRRDKKSLWTLYRKAIAGGLEPEQIHGTIWWQLKSILITYTARTPAESGLNPFVHTKAKGFAQNFSEDELKKSADRLIAAYHDARRGKGELELLLEKWILEI